ncbi:hypothetical protein N7495_008965 [Penicillium taxi]|uniref:uncharacterized protein n=1 Tax=Penicillium taxi TaxID=168475 RepID=UPI0025450FAB|nr:uncharacterized protein N7495_008965 [Penicillium taxi]KAJ5888924.1 hypothetical protein N7495_008965 [Penicillium taxi]
MAAVENGHTNGLNGHNLPSTSSLSALRFSDIPDAIDIPASSFDSEVEVSLLDLPEDPTELCTLLENERAAKNFWVIIALAYAKQKQIDRAIDILNKGLASVAHGANKEKLGLLGWICWLQMLKERQAPRVASEGELYSEAKIKDHYIQLITSTLNEASRINPSYPPLFLARGVLSLLRASLYAPRAVQLGSIDTSERATSLRQAVQSFEESSRYSRGRNIMAIMGLARAKYMQGKYAESLEGYQKVLMQMPSLTDPDPRIGLGCCLWQLGFKDQAKVAWERSLSLNPESKVANVLLSVYHLYHSSRQPLTDPSFGSLYHEAITKYNEKAYRLDRDYPMTCAISAGYFLERNAYPAVETLARKAIENTDVMAIASDGWYLRGRKAHYEGDPLATEFYNRSDLARGGVDKGYFPAKFAAVQLQIANKDLDGAKFRLEKIVQNSKRPEAMMLLAALLAEDVFAAQRSGSKEDKSTEASRAISLLESVRSMWKDEKRQVVPDESVLIYLSRLYETTAPDKSMQCLTQLEQIQIDCIPKGARPEGIESEEEMRTALRELLPPQLLNNMGCFLYQNDNIALARGMFQSALNANDKSERDDKDSLRITITYNLGRTFEAADMMDEAKQAYESILEQHSDYTEASARLTYIALRQSPTDEGPKKMAKLYETDSSNLEVRALFGWYLSKSKKRVANLAEDPEQRHFKHTLQYHDKHDRYALTGMGNVHLMSARDMRRDTDQEKEKRRKIYQRAVEFFDKALQLDPQNAYAAQGIAIALVDDKKDFATALQILTRVRETVKDPSVYLNLGHVYGEQRQYSRAIENYEAALSKDRARDVQILACLGRVWWLKAKQEMNMMGMKTALDYALRALSVSPDQLHLQFNVAFVQNQIASLAYGLKETQKTSQDVQEAADGLKEAIETFERLAALEQRANMGRTISKQLDRAMQSQTEYEEKNATKLREAREIRDAAIKVREEELRKAQEAELERKRKLAKEREQMLEETQQLARDRAEAERARELAELTEDSETGEKVKRKKRASTKRKKKDDDFIADEEHEQERDQERDQGSAEPESDTEAPKKKRRLERRSTAGTGKFKSNERVVDSDSDEGADPETSQPSRSTGKFKSNERVIESDSDEE